MQYTELAHPTLPYPVCMVHGGGASGAPFEGSRFDASRYDQSTKQQVPRWTTSNAIG